MEDEINVIVSGVGGQGILFATNVIIRTALEKGLNFAQSEVHGLAQRYGSIHTEIRIGPKVKSPLILEGTLDLLIAMEPLEAMRYANYVSERTTIISNSHIVPPQSAFLERFPIPSIDEIKDLLLSLNPRGLIMFDATEIASKQVGDPIVTNSVMLGGASATGILPFSAQDIRGVLQSLVPEKYKESNMRAFDLGYKEVKRILGGEG
ncbi:MAG: hypothetical protein DRO00_00810 [Thermoproteota archaeon]|nr:MAG: hypothetical protein DRO00_00810 [Candidatus Korarchaeota archaeon]